MTDIALSAATFTVILLLYGAWRIKQRDGAGRRMWLMIGAALVIALNIAIWTIPNENGTSLVGEMRAQEAHPTPEN